MKKNIHLLIGIAGISILFLSLLQKSFMSKTSKLSGVAFTEKYQNTPNATLLDVRTPNEFSSGHINKAINIDIENSSFTSEIKKLDITKTYFVYCRSGNRSGQAIRVMRSNGIKNIYELHGGLISNIATINVVTIHKDEPEDITNNIYKN